MKRLFRQKRLAIFSDPGTGKTKPVLDFISKMLEHNRIKRALVICPLTAIPVWEEQIEIDAPQLHYSLYTTDSEPDWTAQLIIINYDYFHPIKKVKRSKRTGEALIDRHGQKKKKIDRTILNNLIDWEPDVVITDESHKIKNPHTRTSKATHVLGRLPQYAVCMTGTPRGNNKILDLWSQFQFLVPGLLDDTYSDFKNHYGIWGGFGGYELKKFKCIDELTELIRPYVIRWKNKDLPKENDIPWRVILPLKAKDIYWQMEEQMLAEVEGEKITAPIALAKLMKLTQLTGGFIVTNDHRELEVHRAKLEALDEILEDLESSSVERLVIFARFKWELARIREVVSARKWCTYTIDGSTPLPQRQLAVQLYNSEGGVIICQSATGAGSMNLQAGNYEIFYSKDPSYINYEQARKRISRMGQTKPTFFYHLYCRGTVDVERERFLRDCKSDNEAFMDMFNEIRRRHDKS